MATATVTTATGTPVTFTREGDGPAATVYIPGFAETTASWDALAEELAQSDREVVRIDLPGSGLRTGAATPYAIEAAATDVAAVIDAVGKPATIIAHSMGSQIAELAAISRPELVERLILIDPIPLGGAHAPGQPAPAIDAGELLHSQLDVFAELGDGGQALTTDALAVPADTLQQYCDAFAEGHPAGETTSRFEGKVLLLAGEHDPVSNPAFVESAIAPRFAHAITQTIAGAGHHPHLQATGATAAAIGAFFAAHQD
ncbi:alpha/beta fold hydrolase [Frondihabitans australicus]|uniref:Pimeloyl-ACP methyl ester carboxylesterase n=1 Tax=Frondihabitans australicus TaxID=386892 RepID=A0A495IIP0_9MICO|nr:alpha/beta fold hydrolase [Frondihabitans australicus]RKR75854.1 pimeloyl-ACP methyl ester carboxylesterase [Frondihabitans australicus]